MGRDATTKLADTDYTCAYNILHTGDYSPPILT